MTANPTSYGEPFIIEYSASYSHEGSNISDLLMREGSNICTMGDPLWPPYHVGDFPYDPYKDAQPYKPWYPPQPNVKPLVPTNPNSIINDYIQVMKNQPLHYQDKTEGNKRTIRVLVAGHTDKDISLFQEKERLVLKSLIEDDFIAFNDRYFEFDSTLEVIEKATLKDGMLQIDIKINKKKPKSKKIPISTK